MLFQGSHLLLTQAGFGGTTERRLGRIFFLQLAYNVIHGLDRLDTYSPEALCRHA